MPMKQRANALEAFQNDPPTTIFLLSIRAAACGINLTQANRVFILEPLLNPAIEQQAVGRVHRLGQKRDVEVVRLVMENSVETRIRQMLKKKYGGRAKGGESAAEEADTRKPPPQESVRVGSISREKNDILTEEFDLLYQWTAGVVKDEDAKMPAAGKGTYNGYI